MTEQPQSINEYGVARGYLIKNNEGEYELTPQATDRQDDVDNDIHSLICRMMPEKYAATSDDLDWDIEPISEIRDIIQRVLTEQLVLTDQRERDEFEMEFHPYVELPTDDSPQPDYYRLGPLSAYATDCFIRLLDRIATCSIQDPGESDLDNEQPVSCALNLGDVRLVRSVLYQIKKESHGKESIANA